MEGLRTWSKALKWTMLGWVFLITSTQSQLPDDPITCQASMRDVASVTCHFPFDVNATKKDFVVLYYRPTDADSYIILSCNWDEQPVPVCYVEDSVTFNYVVTNQLTATVLPGVVQVGGEFVCHLVPALDTRCEKCYLNHTDDPVNPTPEPESLSDVSDSRDRYPGHGTLVALYVILTFLITVVMCLAMFCFLARRSRMSMPQLLPSRFANRDDEARGDRRDSHLEDQRTLALLGGSDHPSSPTGH